MRMARHASVVHLHRKEVEVMGRNREHGFTVGELIVVVAIASIIAVMLFGGYRLGLLRDAALSADARSLVSALNYARVRGIEDRAFARVVNISVDGAEPDPDNPGVTWYSKMIFKLEAEEEPDLKYLDGDFVTFTGMEKPPFVDLNDMSHTIHPVSGSDFIPSQSGDKWNLNVMIEFPSSIETGGDEVTTYDPKAAFMKCLSRASKLVIRKQSTIDKTDPRFATRQYFVYHDNQVRIAMEPEESGGAIPDDSIIVSFDSLGFATRDEGYRLWLMRAQDNPLDAMDTNKRKSMQLKVVNVTPLGRTFLWKRYTKAEEKALEGKEGL